MLWLYLALTAYFINAVVFVIDKYLLAGHIPRYNAYAFGVSILSLSSLVLIPFGVTWNGFWYFILAIASGGIFYVGLILLYKTIKQSDITLASTQVGAFGAIFTYIFSVLILRESLPLFSLVAFFFLLLGIFLLGKVERHVVRTAIFAGVLFGLSFVLLKLSFNNSEFINGLFWTRMGFVGSAFLSLLNPRTRKDTALSYHEAPRKSKFLFVFNKVLAGVGFIILYFSISLGDVSLVNALLGSQFLFTFLLVLTLSNRIPQLKENMSPVIFKEKLFGILSVLIGLALLIKK